MVNSLEVDALDRALRTIVTERLKSFVGEKLNPQTVAAMAATAQTFLFEAGRVAGYDWRCIHFKIEAENYKSVLVQPEGLDADGDELLNAVMEKYKQCNANCVQNGYPDYDCPKHGFRAQHQDDWGGHGEEIRHG